MKDWRVRFVLSVAFKHGAGDLRPLERPRLDICIGMVVGQHGIEWNCKVWSYGGKYSNQLLEHIMNTSNGTNGNTAGP